MPQLGVTPEDTGLLSDRSVRRSGERKARFVTITGRRGVLDNRRSFTTTFRVTAPVGFSSHAFWSLIRNDTRMPTGTSVKVISYRSGGNGWRGMAAKLRQLG